MSSENHQLTTTSNTSTKTDTTTSSSEEAAAVRTPINNSVNESNNRRTSKVSRCFGKTMCMPPLLCFKVRQCLFFFGFYFLAFDSKKTFFVFYGLNAFSYWFIIFVYF